MQYRALFLQQYRTVDPVPRPQDFEAANDDEAVGKALGLATDLDARYGKWLHGVARLEEGKPTTLIFENGKRVEKPILLPEKLTAIAISGWRQTM